ncbi:hypothetical protein [Cupriavidus necator]|uniref:hypothetical protein n=1 Tax=Cupriavidus necator TaxID=106590 RepID=UPI0005B4A7E7|nr:hypothetical protein [Cupriavidus necator]
MLQTLGPLWTQARVPRVLIEAHGVDDKLAAQLHAYYVNGGRANFSAMMRTLAAQQFRMRADDGIPAPVAFPKGSRRPPTTTPSWRKSSPFRRKKHWRLLAAKAR